MPTAQAKLPNDKIPAAEFLALREYLLARGVAPGEVGQAIGAAAGDRSRREVADKLRVWLKGRPRRR
jgi:hypothetical protein